jgi:hypothetical protein
VKERAAVGFSVHTGWAASVLVGGTPRSPRILDRREIRLSHSENTLEAEVYHRAAELSASKALPFVKEAQKDAARRALEALRSLSSAHPLVAAGVLVSAVTLPSDLAAILRSHPMVHTAEGALYRDALAGGAEVCGLEVVRIPRRELATLFARALCKKETQALDWLASIGKEIGPPWARDQKDAAMAAIVALSEAGSLRPPRATRPASRGPCRGPLPRA